MNHYHLYPDNILCGFFIIILPLKPLSSISLKCNSSLILMEQTGPLPGVHGTFLLFAAAGEHSVFCPNNLFSQQWPNYVASTLL